ncbi:O-antigen ligase family protein [Nocardioides sambongensis]|uniref:O-antigen ligase family protein n=1 Tax=Nocardioides sambongensis TaxID=2589074 RepID=UPI00112D5880|nr:O-antigen ligase family protein [Nocardioides sambongensis]
MVTVTQSGFDGTRLLTAYWITLLVVPAPMVIGALGQVGGPSTLIALTCALAWGWEQINRSEPAPTLPNMVRNAALVFLAAILVSYVNSALLPLPGDERSPADGALLKMVGAVGVVCLLCEGIRSMNQLWKLVERIVLGMGAVSALAMFQMATGEVWVDRISVPGLSAAEGLSVIQRGAITRPSGTATHPIEFAAFLAIGMPFALAVAARARHHSWLYRTIAVLVPLQLLLVGSRTAIVCGAVAFLVMLAAWRGRTRLLALGGSVVMMAVLFVAMPGLVGTIRGLFEGASGDPSVKSRTNSYVIVGEFWSHHPWFGRGVGTFLPKYWILDNQYLNLLMGAGLVGVVGLLALVAVASAAAGRSARVFDDAHDRVLAVAALAAIVAGAVSLALFDAFSFPQAAGLFFMSIGISGCLQRLSRLQYVKSLTAQPGEPARALIGLTSTMPPNVVGNTIPRLGKGRRSEWCAR